MIKVSFDLTILSETLEDWGAVDRPLSEPPCTLRGKRLVGEKIGSIQSGVWQCSPGRFRRNNPYAEMMWFLSGRCRFTHDDGSVIDINAGDFVYLPARTEGIWDIYTLTQKQYTLFSKEIYDASMVSVR